MRSRVLAAAALLAACATGPAYAYSVTPMSVRLAPIGPQASYRVTVSNTDPAPLDATFTVAQVKTTEDGKRVFTPAPSDFVVFPPQATIRPGATQSVMVRYVGRTPEKGVLYTLRVGQQNVVEHEQGTGPTTFVIRLVQDFLVAMLVEPEKAKPNVVFVTPPAPKGQGIETVVRNDGNGVAALRDLPWTITVNGASTPVDFEKMQYGDTQYVSPGETRRIFFEAPANATVTLGRPN